MEESTTAAPPVVAVLVACDPGPWFDEVLGSLASQDYPNLRVLVLDVGTSGDLAARVGAVLPGAFLRRLEANPGFGAAANEAARLVEGGGFFLFLHDDVALDRSAVRLLVEETYRSNAGIAGPKLVRWDGPDRLESVGFGSDKYGEYVPLAEPGELDQEQHDAVRDVFVLPTACLLMRTDLFRTLDGFDPTLGGVGDARDLCWRAHLSGARVLVVPAARARHHDAAFVDRDALDERAEERSRFRTVLSVYSPLRLLLIGPLSLVVTGMQVVTSALAGRRRRAGALLGAWGAVLADLGGMAAKRRTVKGIRQIPDHEIRRLQIRGSARLRAFLRGQGARREQRLSVITGAGRGAVEFVRTGANRELVFVWLVLVALFLLGSRELVTGSVPAYGGFLAFPGSALDLARQYLSGWWPHGLGAPVPTPAGVALVGAGGVFTFGAMGLLRTLLVLGPVVAGYVGMWRLTRPLGGSRARIGGLIAYAACPLPYNALAEGKWGGVVAYGAAPFVLGRLARLTRLAPFGPVGGEPGEGVPERSVVAQVAALAILVAVVAAFVPTYPLVVTGMAAVLVLASLVCGHPLAALRGLAGGVAGAAGAVVLLFPWSAGTLVGEVALGGVPLAGPVDRGFWAVLRFETGPYGAGFWPYLLWGAAVAGVVIGREWRLAWAGRGLVLATAALGLAWAVDRGSIGLTTPGIEVLLTPAAVGLALAVACGGVATERDLRGTRLSWRQPVAVLGTAALAVTAVPMALATVDGRWTLPRTDLTTTLSFLPRRDPGGYRILWVGDPRVMPLPGWTLVDGVAYGLSQDGAPDLLDAWPGRVGRPEELVRDALTSAADGATNRLGAMLGPMAVRYLVVPSRAAPAVEGTALHPAPEGLLVALDSQLDLRRIDLDDAVTVYENTSWIPARSVLGPAASQASEVAGFETLVRADLSGSTAVLPPVGGPSSFEGALPAGRVFVSARASDGWSLEVGGTSLTRAPAFGWANAFDVAAPGAARLTYDTPLRRTAEVVLQGLLWLAAAALVVHGATAGERRRRAGERRAQAEVAGQEAEVLIDLGGSAPVGGSP